MTSNSIINYATSLYANKNTASGGITKANAQGDVWFSGMSWNGQLGTGGIASPPANYYSTEFLQGSGSLTGYTNSVSATLTGAASSQNINSASMNTIGLQSSAQNKEGDSSTTTTQITNTQSSSNPNLAGYSDKSTASSSIVSSSKRINYAAGNIGVTTQASQGTGGEKANVLSTVTGGYIFLYSDKSTATLHPNAFTKYADASADIKAYGTTNVQINEINPKYSTSKTIPNFPNKKLVATVDSSVADSINRPSAPITSVWNDLALIALQTNAVYLPVLGGPYGHVGVAVWNTDGTWTVGAVQANGKSWPFVSPGTYNGGWVAPHVSWLDAESYLGGVKVNQRPGIYNGPSPNTGNGIYDTIKIVKMSSGSTPDPANTYMSNFWDRGFGPNIQVWGSGMNVCLDAVVGTLQKDGVTGPASAAIHLPAPKDYFNSLTGPNYQQYNLDSVLPLYVPAP